MKRLIIIWILIAGLGLLAAHNRQLAYFSTSELAQEMSLRDNVRALTLQGWDIYHYTQSCILASTPEGKGLPSGSAAKLISPIPQGMRLYLVGRMDQAPFDIPESAGKVILDMGDAILLQSSLDEVELRQMIPYPFSTMDYEPLRFAPDGMNIDPSSMMRTDINQMLSLVSSASVQSMIQSLQDFATRYALAPNHLQVAEWIRDKYQSFGITDVQLFPFAWNGTTQYNVIATIPGTVYPDKYIVVGGHHDSINQHGDPYQSAPGADDNASGSVATLEMARVMMQSGFAPRTSIRFMTFAAEEFGLWGSKAYAQWAYDNDVDIKLMINHDMISNNTTASPNWQVRLMPYDGSMNHSAHASNITQNYTTLNTVYGALNGNNSDSYPFWQKGYNVIWFFENDFSPYYHSSNDVVANIDPLYAAEVIKASTAVATVFSNMPSAPSTLFVYDVGTGNSLAAVWSAVQDPQVTGYRIYYGTQLDNMGYGISVIGPQYTITGLTQGQTYYVAVSTIDLFGNESYRIYSTGTPLLAPLTPTAFDAQPLPGCVRLTWDPNLELDLAGYKVYKSTQAGETGELLVSSPASTGSYLDMDVSGGQHYYYYSMQAVDIDGNASPFTPQVRSRPVTMDQGILIVDETRNLGGTNPFQPNDAQVDDFYAAAMTGFGFHELDLEQITEPVRLADIGIYSSILWHGNDTAEMDYPYFVREELSKYVEMGGNILFSVYQPSLAFELNGSYPASFDADTFINSVNGIEGCHYMNQARFKRALPQSPAYPALEVDPLKSNQGLNYHLMRIEGMDASPNATVIYRYGSNYSEPEPQASLNNMAVGILNEYGYGKVITLSFPLYNMMADQVQALLYHVFHDVFMEYSPNEDPTTPAIKDLVLDAPWPNPFSKEVSISIKTGESNQPLSIKIYNQRGQLVRKLHQGLAGKSMTLVWDGKDEAGRRLSSGIYLIKASQNGKTAQRKMVLIK